MSSDNILSSGCIDQNMCVMLGGEKVTWMLMFFYFIKSSEKPWDNVNSSKFRLWVLILHSRNEVFLG